MNFVIYEIFPRTSSNQEKYMEYLSQNFEVNLARNGKFWKKKQFLIFLGQLVNLFIKKRHIHNENTKCNKLYFSNFYK